MSREFDMRFKKFHGMGRCPGADFMSQVFCYNATNLHLFLSVQRGALEQLITFSISIHSMLYLKSLKLERDIESYYMKTVIWGSRLVLGKYQRLLNFLLLLYMFMLTEN